MKTVTAPKNDYRFEPIVIKAKPVALGHQNHTCRGGYHQDKRLARQGTRHNQVKAYLKDYN